jgi:hypothetical protein
MAYDTFLGIGNVTLLDKNGNIFYKYFPQNKYREFYFNVAIKDFEVIGRIKKARRTLKYLVQLEGEVVNVPEIKIQFAPNPRKATVYRNTGLIVFDTSFRLKPIILLMFLYAHEMAHFAYPSVNGVRTKENESKCDIWGAKFLLLKGYNPSQILAGMKFALKESNETQWRFDQMVNFLDNVKKVII